MGEEHLLHAFVTSCQLESFFAVIDDVNRASNFISVTENRGQAMAIKSHTFMTAEERLRQEVRRRKKCKEDPMTREEAEAYLDLEPLAMPSPHLSAAWLHLQHQCRSCAP